MTASFCVAFGQQPRVPLTVCVLLPVLEPIMTALFAVNSSCQRLTINTCTLSSNVEFGEFGLTEVYILPRSSTTGYEFRLFKNSNCTGTCMHGLVPTLAHLDDC
jgi:hypothetical protein